jgi:hypothetical protein
MYFVIGHLHLYTTPSSQFIPEGMLLTNAHPQPQRRLLGAYSTLTYKVLENMRDNILGRIFD